MAKPSDAISGARQQSESHHARSLLIATIQRVDVLLVGNTDNKRRDAYGDLRQPERDSVFPLLTLRGRKIHGSHIFHLFARWVVMRRIERLPPFDTPPC
jgi:hypothetical protein